MIQLYEMIVVRHGLMLVGPTGGGKSSNLHVLEETLSRLKQMGKEVNTVPYLAFLGRLRELSCFGGVLLGRGETSFLSGFLSRF